LILGTIYFYFNNKDKHILEIISSAVKSFLIFLITATVFWFIILSIFGNPSGGDAYSIVWVILSPLYSIGIFLGFLLSIFVVGIKLQANKKHNN
jgi:O-antigen/teichoic acid export membrane protein